MIFMNFLKVFKMNIKQYMTGVLKSFNLIHYEFFIFKKLLKVIKNPNKKVNNSIFNLLKNMYNLIVLESNYNFIM